MFFGVKELDGLEIDMTSPEGRQKALEQIEKGLEGESPIKKKLIMSIFTKMFGVMDAVPKPFLYAQEVKQELDRMGEIINGHATKLSALAKTYRDPQLVFALGTIDSYLTVAQGSVAAVSSMLEGLSERIAKAEVEKEERKAAREQAADDGPSGREAPTEPPPAPPPAPPMAAEAPLG